MRYDGLKLAFAIALAGAGAAVCTAYFSLPRVQAAARSDVATVDVRPDAPAPAPIAPPAPPAPASEVGATLAAVGDIMLSRSVATAIKDAGDAKYPFAMTRDFLRSADLVFANLETPITKGRVVKPGEMSFRSDPETVDGMKDAGVSVVSLANNHTPNFGAKGILDTVSYLDAAGILHAGAGKDADAAEAPAFIERGGLRFAFLAYNDADVVPKSYGAAPKHPGTNIMDLAKLADAVRAARSKADAVIVSMHSGIEYKDAPDDRQTAFAHAAIDAGADAVIGHHPHVVQTIEIYKGKPIIYSLGNFVFDQDWSEETKNGLAVMIRFGKDGAERIELDPIYLAKTGQPAPADPAQAAHVIARLKAPVADLTAYAWAKGATAPAVEKRKAVLVTSPARGCAPVAADLDGDGVAEYVGIGEDGACGDGRIAVWRGTGLDERTVWQSAERGFTSISVEKVDGREEIVAFR